MQIFVLMQIEYTVDTIQKAAQSIWKKFSGKRIWAFDAPMGAGKTTFIKALCESVLQCDDVISSPTFSIINEYNSKVTGTVYHMDWYRLKDEEEAVQAGVEEALRSGNICLIEWPERALQLLPNDTLFLKINSKGEKERSIFIKEKD